MIGHQVICSGFIEKDNKILIIFCPKFKVWRVPGGRTEHGERIEDTFIREMEEELQITFKDPKFVGFGQDTQFHVQGNRDTSHLLLFFHVKTDKEPVVDPEESEEHKWVTLEELKALKEKEGSLTDFFKRNPDFTL